MEVVLDAVDEELHHVLRRWRSLRSLPLDDRQQLGDDFTLDENDRNFNYQLITFPKFVLNWFYDASFFNKCVNQKKD